MKVSLEGKRKYFLPKIGSAIGCFLSLLLGCLSPTPIDRELSELLGDLTSRPLSGRLSSEVSYRPLELRGSDSRARERAIQRHRARIRGELAALEDQGITPSLLKASALVSLLDGDQDRAIADLDEAIALNPRDIGALNDGAAAYLERGLAHDRPLDLLAALGRIRRAAAAAPDSATVAFNQALILHHLYLRRSAAKAWQHFLALERRGGWAREAERYLAADRDESYREGWQSARLELLRGSPLSPTRLRYLVERYPRQLFELSEETLLARLAAVLATQAGDDGGASIQLEAIARALAEKRGDLLLLDSLHAVRQALGSDRLNPLAQAHMRFEAGMASYRSQDFPVAEALLVEAEEGFRNTASPMVSEATFYRAICIYYRDAAGSRHWFEGPLEDPLAGRYPGLRGRAAWMLGVTDLVQGRLEAAIQRFRQMRTYWQQAAGGAQAGMADIELASVYDRRGEAERAWRHRLRGFAALTTTDSPRRRHSLYIEAAHGLAQSGEADLAVAFLDECLDNAAIWAKPLAFVEMYTLRSRLRSRTGDDVGALVDAQEALRRSSLLRAGPKSRAEAAALMSRGIALVTHDPRRALAITQSAYDQEKSSAWEVEKFVYLRSMAEANLRLGERVEAVKFLTATVQGYETLRGDAVEPSARKEIFRYAQSAFDDLLRLTPPVDLQGTRTSLSYAERARARGFLDDWASRSARPSSTSGRPASAEEITSRLPADLTLVEFATLADRTLYWVVQNGKLQGGSLPIPRADLERQIDTLRYALELDQNRPARKLLERLYEEVIRPLPLHLDAETTLVVAPDGPLQRLPFAALFDAQARTFLIERSPLTVVPSASLALALLPVRRARAAQASASESALVVGAPDLTATPYARLQRLPGALEEAQLVASFYPAHRLLVGKDATPEAFVDALPLHSVVHFAGHAVAADPPAKSAFLLLTPDPAHPEGTLALSALRALPGTPPRVVVLAACGALGGRSQGREGLLSIASGFFSAGVPAIIAPLWAINDRASVDVMTALHRNLKTNADISRAVRETLVEFIHGRDSERAEPSYWAAFSSLGL